MLKKAASLSLLQIGYTVPGRYAGTSTRRAKHHNLFKNSAVPKNHGLD
jgi:hypothetical protein